MITLAFFVIFIYAAATQNAAYIKEKQMCSARYTNATKEFHVYGALLRGMFFLTAGAFQASIAYEYFGLLNHLRLAVGLWLISWPLYEVILYHKSGLEQTYISTNNSIDKLILSIFGRYGASAKLCLKILFFFGGATVYLWS